MDNFKVLTLEHMEDMEQVVGVLSRNGYKVHVEPAYETAEELKAQGIHINRYMRPRIKHYAVEIVGTVEKPVYVED